MKATGVFGPLAIARPLWAMALILGLSACSGGAGDSQGNDAATVDVLNAGDTAEVYEGDELERTTDDATIEVRHEQATNRKFVTILTGTAELIRGEYYENL